MAACTFPVRLAYEKPRVLVPSQFSTVVRQYYSWPRGMTAGQVNRELASPRVHRPTRASAHLMGENIVGRGGELREQMPDSTMAERY